MTSRIRNVQYFPDIQFGQFDILTLYSSNKCMMFQGMIAGINLVGYLPFPGIFCFHPPVSGAKSFEVFLNNEADGPSQLSVGICREQSGWK